MRYIHLVFILCIAASLSAQCYQDRHDTSLKNAWYSCNESVNPNPDRASGHWLQYDLGEVKALLNSHVWNVNHPEKLDDGAKTIMIDLSFDGVTWTEWGSWTLEHGTASGFYEGQEGPDFDREQTRYVLMTITENHGGTCYGLGEIKIFTDKAVSVTDTDASSMLSLAPNPAIAFTEVKINSNYTGTANLQLLDMSGKVVKQETVNIGNAQSVKVDLAAIPEGQYLIRISNGQINYSAELTKISNQ